MTFSIEYVVFLLHREIFLVCKSDKDEINIENSVPSVF